MLAAVISRSSKADVVICRRRVGDDCMAIIAFGRLNRMLTVERTIGTSKRDIADNYIEASLTVHIF